MKKLVFLVLAAALAASCGAALAQSDPASEPEGTWLAEVLPGGDQLIELAAADLPEGDLGLGLVTTEGPPEEALMELAAADGPPGSPAIGPGPMGPGQGPGPMMGGAGQARGARWMQFRGMRGRQGIRMGAMMMRAAKAIGLTDEQMNRLRGMRVAHQREMIRLRADAQIARLDLEEALRQPNAKFADVKAKVAAISALHGQMMEKKVAFRLDARQVLTPEQQQKLRELMMGRAMGAWGPGAGAMGRGGWGGGWGQGQKGPQPELKK